MRNVPDDWDGYWHTCGACKRPYHASGTTVCACAVCGTCGDANPPDKMEDDTCVSCVGSCLWAWDGTELDNHLVSLHEWVDDAYDSDLGETEVMHRVELLIAALETVHKRLKSGFSPK